MSKHFAALSSRLWVQYNYFQWSIIIFRSVLIFIYFGKVILCSSICSSFVCDWRRVRYYKYRHNTLFSGEIRRVEWHISETSKLKDRGRRDRDRGWRENDRTKVYFFAHLMHLLRPPGVLEEALEAPHTDCPPARRLSSTDHSIVARRGFVAARTRSSSSIVRNPIRIRSRGRDRITTVKTRVKPERGVPGAFSRVFV